jgi:hypothetical protein
MGDRDDFDEVVSNFAIDDAVGELPKDIAAGAGFESWPEKRGLPDQGEATLEFP